MRLLNKVALVTGASSGIGKAITEAFVKEGATVFASDRRGNPHYDVDDSLIRQIHFTHLDVTNEDNWQSVITTLGQTQCRLDILVNNAGITGFNDVAGPFDPEQLDLQSWRDIHATNLDGVALGCKYGIALMKSSRAASIVNISSRSGMVGIPAAAAYASSKAGVRNHTKTVALYCAEKGYPIRCNSIHPGAILTPMWDAMLGSGSEREAAIAAIAADVPMNRMGAPNDVAMAALFLASEESAYITGTELTVDGGILAGSIARPTPNNNDK